VHLAMPITSCIPGSLRTQPMNPHRNPQSVVAFQAILATFRFLSQRRSADKAVHADVRSIVRLFAPFFAGDALL
jgi:hypothetical protein